MFRNRKTCVWLVAFLGSMFAFTTAHAQLSLVAGANFGDFSDIQLDNQKATFESATGYHVGATFELGILFFKLRPGLIYRNFGDLNTDSDLSDIKLNFFDVPLDAKFRLGVSPVIQPFVLVGPVFSFPNASSDSVNVDDLFETMTVSLAVGGGITVGVLGFRLTPEIRYEFGISNLVKENVSFDGMPEIAIQSDPPASVILRLGIGI